jgi:gliding motility-associated-like protein
MLLKYYITTTVIFLNSICYSQNQNNIWYFGDHAGISFNTTPPSTLNDGVFIHSEGVASICDINGNLLFFTNGLDVWNANRVRMPNGFGLFGNSSSSQVLIIPKPSDCNIYYIFTMPAQNFTDPFSYTIVDMSLNGGLGDVSSKNILLRTGITERITGTLKSNGIDYWVVTQEFGSNAFLSYSITATGVNPTPVVSNAGIGSLNVMDVLGYMKISGDGSKLATACTYGHARSQLFDFDNSTGIVSNAILLNSDNVAYGVEFSPDNSRLYFATANTPFIITQYNLLAGNAAAIANSGIQIVNQYIINGVAQYGGALQLGPDNKIYANRLTKAFLDVIDQPNSLGAACNYTFSAIDLNGHRCQNGLPNCIKNYATFSCAALTATVIHTSCGNNNGTITASYINGLPPYQYSLDAVNFQAGNIFTGLASGNHTVWAKDANQVMLTVNKTINSSIGVQCSISSIANSTCGSANGIVTASPVGGTTPFQYSINGGGTYQSSNIFTGLLAGSYTVTIKDGNNCLNNSSTVTVVNTAGATVTASPANSTCGLANGIVTASPVGGTAPFQYSINGGGTYQSSNIFTGLLAGPYTVTIKDGNNCLNNSSTVTVVNIAGATVTATPINAVCGFTNGKIITNASGGTSPYLYSTDGGITYQNSNVFTNLAPANYTVYIKDANSCINTIFVLVGNTPMPVLQIFAGKDTEIVIRQPLQLNAVDVNNIGFVSYNWSPTYGLNRPDIKNPISILDKDFVYEVIAATSDGCIAKDTIKIRATYKSEIYIPNAFTPNGDGKNDVLRPKLIGIKELKYFVVYNRYGEIVYKSTNENQGWDGLIKGASQNNGTYIWMAEAVDYAGRTVFRKGVTVLIK